MPRTRSNALSCLSVAAFGLFLAACGSDQPGGQNVAKGGNLSGAASTAGNPNGGSSSGGQVAAEGGASGGSAAGAMTAGGANTGGSKPNNTAGTATGGGGAAGADAQGIPADATVVLFYIDGLQTATVQTGIANGATNLKFLIDNGVTAQTMLTTSPATKASLADGSLPWGNATSGNVAAHTGTHLFESNQMDDIFLEAKAAGIKSVYAGGDANYSVFTTADFHYSGMLSDDEVVKDAIDRLKSDHVRLLRLHLQRIRDSWAGPSSETDAAGPYIQHLIQADGLLGTLRKALEDEGVWAHTYVILSSDHGMGGATGGEHPPAVLSSWKNFLTVYGPGIKQGATIPYAETPDVPVLAAHLLKLAPLKGHTDPAVTLTHKGATGTLLSNVFEGAPAELAHPRYIEKYLNTGTYTGSADSFADYRLAMLKNLQ
jgi:Type I phosphodiesterase / nucleotide pyrophosphatase